MTNKMLYGKGRLVLMASLLLATGLILVAIMATSNARTERSNKSQTQTLTKQIDAAPEDADILGRAKGSAI